LEITMKKLLGLMLTGGLLLAHGSVSQAQMTVQFGRGGTPRVMMGQPTYGQYAGSYRQPYYSQPGTYYQPGYAQPGYSPSYYARPSGTTYYSSGYSAPGGTYYRGYAAPSYLPQTSYYGNGYSPYAQPGYGSGTGLIINGRSYMLPR